jgi:hypothetical protein
MLGLPLELPGRMFFESSRSDALVSVKIEHHMNLQRNKVDVRESRAISQILALVETEKFGYLKICPCGKWYLAARGDSKACSKRHHRDLYEKTVEYRKHRADYMKKYRNGFKEDK